MLEGQIEDPVEIEEYLCRFYIERVGDIVQGATCFLQSDATVSAEIFLLKCIRGFTEKPYPIRRFLKPNRLWACRNQLLFHTATYFPRYRVILTQRYVEELHPPDNGVLIGAGWNGILHLVAASLPRVREEINRELRRRGLNYDAAKVRLVTDAVEVFAPDDMAHMQHAVAVAAGATMRQACTAAGIDPDAPLVGIPEAAFKE